MPLALIFFTSLFCTILRANSATTDDMVAGQALAVNDKLVSENGRYALGFFNTSTGSSQSVSSWYLGIWFNKIPKFTSAWVANRDSPIRNTTSIELTISQDGNLVILDRSTGSIVWSTEANITGDSTSSTIAMLMSNGNLVLRNSTNSSQVLWQSFDSPTDTLLPGAKLGWDKVTGLRRSLVSWRNTVDPAAGAFREELDPSGVNQFVLTPSNSSMPYWSSGVWNGNTFASFVNPGYTGPNHNNFTFVDTSQERYFQYNIEDENVLFMIMIDFTGQSKQLIWFEGSSQDWEVIYAQPKSQCDAYAVCGPFTICNDGVLLQCSCMEGFSVASLKDWDLQDRTSGCSRNTPLDCITSTTDSSTDKFYSVPCVRLPENGHIVQTATSPSECTKVCLSNCSCTAYTFGKEGCSIWYTELLNIKQLQCSGTANSNGDTIYLRMSAKYFHSSENNTRKIVIGLITGIGISALILVLFIWRKQRKSSSHMMNGSQGCHGVMAFGYADLQRATKSFTDKLGEGSFGSVFMGILNDSTTIAVKRLDFSNQGEKQFRAEVSSIGAVQHINIVKLVGFCCEGSRRMLVYEHMPNRSLDIHLFKYNSEVLDWTTRYQIALGVARGLAYLHVSCRDYIIHCDIKPENILLDASFAPKIADFGMAKLLGRDCSRVLTTARGTLGYLAPEWISGVPITTKVDVYSYGMVLLEIISGRRNSYNPCCIGEDHDVYFPVYASNKLMEGDVASLVDQMLHGAVNLDEVEIACKVACWCIQDNESARPTMVQVVQVLEGLVQVGMPPIPRLLQTLGGPSHSE